MQVQYEKQFMKSANSDSQKSTVESFQAAGTASSGVGCAFDKDTGFEFYRHRSVFYFHRPGEHLLASPYIRLCYDDLIYHSKLEPDPPEQTVSIV